MRKSLVYIATVWICMSANMQGTAQDVMAVSYNIRLDHAGDNDNNWHHRKADMVDYLTELDADFVGLQEAIGHQLRHLDQGLSSYTYIGVGRDDGADGGEYSPIFYDSTQWQLIESNTFWLSATPHKVSRGWDAACHRVVTYGIFAAANGKKVAVLNTHFDHVGHVARRESLALINRFVLSFDKNMPIVLMGDFNFTPDDDNYQKLTAQLADCFDLSTDAGRQVGTYNGFGADADTTRRIDYMLVNKAFRLKSYAVPQPKTQKGLQLSDHYPVIVHLQIEE